MQFTSAFSHIPVQETRTHIHIHVHIVDIVPARCAESKKPVGMLKHVSHASICFITLSLMMMNGRTDGSRQESAEKNLLAK